MVLGGPECNETKRLQRLYRWEGTSPVTFKMVIPKDCWSFLKFTVSGGRVMSLCIIIVYLAKHFPLECVVVRGEVVLTGEPILNRHVQ